MPLSTQNACGLRLTLAAVLLLSCPAFAAGADLTRFFPLDHPVYHYLDRLQERGRLLSLDRALRPYTRRQVSRAVSAQARDGLRAFELAWLEWLARECATEIGLPVLRDPARLTVISRAEASAELRSLTSRSHDETIGVGFGGRFGPFVFDARTVRSPHSVAPPDSTEHRDPDVLAPLQGGFYRPMESYLKADWSIGGEAFGAELFFGRMARNWSPLLDGSLILSGQAGSFDHLSLALRSRHIAFSHLVARLDDMDFRLPDGSFARANRYLTVHRLDIRIRDHTRFGISESTVYGGEGAGFNPALMNPFTSYRLTAIQDNKSNANNTLAAFDAFFCPFRRLSLYGQLLFDDFLRNEDIQNRWALQGGLDLRDPPLLGGSTVGLRGTVASSFVYGTFQPWERYLLSGRSLGAELGSDYWSAGGYFRRFLGPGLDLRANLNITERGSRRIAMPSRDLIGSAGLPFPSPTVMYSTTAALEMRWQATYWASLNAVGGILRERNIDNHPGENRRRGFGALTVSLYRDIPINF